MRKRFFLMLSLVLSIAVFSCKSQQKTTEDVTPPEPVVEKPSSQKEIIVQCPADMKKVDVLMAQQLEDVAETIKALKPKTVVITGHTAKLNSEREELAAVDKQIQLIIGYLDSIGALDYTDVVVENKGASTPIADHSDIAGRNLNRRVVITLE
ncbi:MAG: hypothetical protein IJU92_09735 [Spirochaetaceae bacterium]|nr:hypothetical protein [Spirochaetaceae bacterium]